MHERLGFLLEHLVQDVQVFQFPLQCLAVVRLTRGDLGHQNAVLLSPGLQSLERREEFVLSSGNVSSFRNTSLCS